MSDIQTRPFSKNYSGLINQTVIAVVITVACVSGHEFMKRKRRGKGPYESGLGSRESWEFGYLYQGRSWARNPSPPTPSGWPLSWIMPVVRFPEAKMNELRGVDATLYVRFLRGCFWYTLLHALTTFPVLFPIHVRFADENVSEKSMTRASISSLVETPQGGRLLWIHICLLFYLTFTWIATLFWVCHGAFTLRADGMATKARRILASRSNDDPEPYHPHPHPQYGFTEVLPADTRHFDDGMRLRTVMVSNLIPQLMDEKELKEYFEFYLSRKIERPVLPLNATTQPGFIHRSLAFLFNRAKRLPAHLTEMKQEGKRDSRRVQNDDGAPAIERVVVARKMTELSSLLERREEIIRLLETCHIKLAKKVLDDVALAMDFRDAHKPFTLSRVASRATIIAKTRNQDLEAAEVNEEQTHSEEAQKELLIEVLGPFVEEFGLRPSKKASTKSRPARSYGHDFRLLRTEGSQASDDGNDILPASPSYPPASTDSDRPEKLTVWDALISLPRDSLDAYQPLVSLSRVFRGQPVPAIDYYTAKLNLLSSLITENRSKPASKFDPVSTAFVTFADPEDARRACQYLTVHPNNPMACNVTMAPAFQDLDWYRIMKSPNTTEFLKDSIVSVGVWAFTLFWLFPVSFLVGLVSIQNFSAFVPALKNYLDRHPWQAEVLQSFVPTLLVALLALLIPLILLLIAKKAHTITTLSALHDRIMTRYYKFLIVNVVVFFCVGTVALQSVLAGLRPKSSDEEERPDVIEIVAKSFPTAGPFYVGWMIFTMAMHGGFEIALFGLPLIMYPTTKRQVTPRKRAMGTRPRTFNFYYWLPTHMLVMHVLFLFSLLNPFVIPFGCIYFFIQAGVVKNQLLHVYAKHYEGNGQLILIRIVRYSLDGLILSQAVFLAYMVVLDRHVNIGLAGFLIVFTTVVKLFMTRMCRAQFDEDDATEARIVCYGRFIEPEANSRDGTTEIPDVEALVRTHQPETALGTWRIPAWISFSWSSVRHRPNNARRHPNPFRNSQISRITSKSPILSPEEVSADPSKSEYSPSETRHHTWPPRRNTQPPRTIEQVVEGAETESRPVTAHSPPVSWDDQTTVDLPYDNPFYSRDISSALWLPRNPSGTLDLADTIDMRLSLTVTVSASTLGSWTKLVGQPGSQALSESPSVMSTEGPEFDFSEDPFEDIDGTENINLPPTIAKRVESGEAGDSEIETVSRSTASLRPRYSSSKSGQSSLGVPGTPSMFRKPSTINRIPTGSRSAFRSFSAGTAHNLTDRPRKSSFASMFERGSKIVGSRPDEHAQADFVAANSSASRTSLERPKLKRASNISAHHAIVREVMAEEEDAYVERVEEEAADAQKATAPRSWLTSWMFTKSTQNLKNGEPSGVDEMGRRSHS